MLWDKKQVSGRKTVDKSIAARIQGLRDQAQQCTKPRMQLVSEKWELFQEI